MTKEKERLDKDNDISSVRVRMFASAREAIGEDEIIVKFTGHQISAENLKKNILKMHPALSLKNITFSLAVNYKVVVNGSAVSIGPHDEVAVLPPISGG